MFYCIFSVKTHRETVVVDYYHKMLTASETAIVADAEDGYIDTIDTRITGCVSRPRCSGRSENDDTDNDDEGRLVIDDAPLCDVNDFQSMTSASSYGGRMVMASPITESKTSVDQTSTTSFILHQTTGSSVTQTGIEGLCSTHFTKPPAPEGLAENRTFPDDILSSKSHVTKLMSFVDSLDQFSVGVMKRKEYSLFERFPVKGVNVSKPIREADSNEKHLELARGKTNVKSTNLYQDPISVFKKMESIDGSDRKLSNVKLTDDQPLDLSMKKTSSRCSLSDVKPFALQNLPAMSSTSSLQQLENKFGGSSTIFEKLWTGAEILSSQTERPLLELLNGNQSLRPSPALQKSADCHRKTINTPGSWNDGRHWEASPTSRNTNANRAISENLKQKSFNLDAEFAASRRYSPQLPFWRKEYADTPSTSEIISSEAMDRYLEPLSSSSRNSPKTLTNFQCSCGAMFNSLYCLTVHVKDSGHDPCHDLISSFVDDGTLPQDDPPKLVRGQDMWLVNGQGRSEAALSCIQCQEPFKSLLELTVHMFRTKHYMEIVPAAEAVANNRTDVKARSWAEWCAFLKATTSNEMRSSWKKRDVDEKRCQSADSTVCQPGEKTLLVDVPKLEANVELRHNGNPFQQTTLSDRLILSTTRDSYHLMETSNKSKRKANVTDDISFRSSPKTDLNKRQTIMEGLVKHSGKRRRFEVPKDFRQTLELSRPSFKSSPLPEQVDYLKPDASPKSELSMSCALKAMQGFVENSFSFSSGFSSSENIPFTNWKSLFSCDNLPNFHFQSATENNRITSFQPVGVSSSDALTRQRLSRKRSTVSDGSRTVRRVNRFKNGISNGGVRSTNNIHQAVSFAKSSDLQKSPMEEGLTEAGTHSVNSSSTPKLTRITDDQICDYITNDNAESIQQTSSALKSPKTKRSISRSDCPYSQPPLQYGLNIETANHLLDDDLLVPRPGGHTTMSYKEIPLSLVERYQQSSPEVDDIVQVVPGSTIANNLPVGKTLSPRIQVSPNSSEFYKNTSQTRLSEIVQQSGR